MVRNWDVCTWCQPSSELIAGECLHVGLPSVRLSWSWALLADEQQETKPRVYRIGSLPVSLASFIGRLQPQGRSAQVRGSLTSPALLLWGADPGVDTPVAHAKAVACVPLLIGTSKCPHTIMHVCTHPTNTHQRERQSRWNSGSCLLSFLLVLPTLWAVSSKCFVYGILWGATGVTELWPCPCLETETQ